MRTFVRFAACTAALLAAHATLAADAPVASKTAIQLRNADGQVERLSFDDSLAVGQSRGFETDAGTPVLVTRTESGLRVEMAERTIDIALPDADGDGAINGTGIEKTVRVEATSDGKQPTETRVVVMRKQGESIDDAEIDTIVSQAIDEASTDADGEHKVVIIRKHAKTTDTP